MEDENLNKSKNSWPLSQTSTFCLITGGSRGFGKALAVKIGARLAQGSVLLLLARDVAGLEVTKAQVLQERRDTPEGLRVHVTGFDLSLPNNDAFLMAIKDALGDTKPDAFEEAMIVHNAGSTGDLKKAKEYDVSADWTAHMALNLTSAVCLNSVFLAAFAAVKRKLVINMSSVTAIRPAIGMAMCCSSKAARELYFNTLALEESDIVVLNYDPGTMDTQMYRSFQEMIKYGFREAAEEYQQGVGDNMVLTCETSTERLLKILESGCITSGDHICYYSTS